MIWATLSEFSEPVGSPGSCSETRSEASFDAPKASARFCKARDAVLMRVREVNQLAPSGTHQLGLPG